MYHAILVWGRTLALVSVLVLAPACKGIKIDDGEIPSVYFGKVDPYLGDFFGQFQGVNGKLKLWLDEQEMKILYSGNNGDDILGKKCESQIGSLKEISKRGSTEDGQLKYAIFEFSASKCKDEVWGKELALFFNEDHSKITVQILGKLSWESNSVWCSVEPYPGPEWCNYESVAHFLEGVFLKHPPPTAYQ